MRKPLVLAAFLVAVCLIVGVFYAARVALGLSFARIEAEEARQGIERVRQALQADLRQLDVAAQDYALWDDFYDFVKRDDPTLVDHFFSRAGLDNIDVDVVCGGGPPPRIAPSCNSSPVIPMGDCVPLTPEILQSLAKLRTAAATGIASVSGVQRSAQFVRMPGGAMAVAVRQVRRESDPALPSIGTFVFGRYLDATVLQRLQQTSQAPVRYTLLDAGGQPEASVPASVADWLASLRRGPDPHESGDLLVQTLAIRQRYYAAMSSCATSPASRWWCSRRPHRVRPCWSASNPSPGWSPFFLMAFAALVLLAATCC